MIDAALPEGEDYINLKFCAACPKCKAVNVKNTRNNAFTCVKCKENFCYICNKSIDSTLDHYGEKSFCHLESDPYMDL